jgi:cytidylate kinase
MYFITFSEMLGTNGRKIASQVAKGLNYTFYGEEELFKAASESGFLADIQKLEEKNPPFFEKFFSEKPKIYLDRLQAVILEVAKNGNAVFFGRGSQLLLKSFDCALHVLVIGSTEKRVEKIMEENKVGREVAENLIDRSDHDKRGFLRFAFDEDWLNPHLYDLILNTDKVSVDSAVQMVLSSAKSDEIKACGIDSVKELGILSLNRKAESALLEAGIMNPYLFVKAEDADTLRIYGMVSTGDEKGSVEDLLKKIKGVKKIINELQLFRGAMSAV